MPPHRRHPHPAPPRIPPPSMPACSAPRKPPPSSVPPIFLATLVLLLLLPPVFDTVQPPQTSLHTDHATRLHHALVQRRSSPKHHYLRWLHTPKTGTSFGNTLLRWGCPSIPPNLFLAPISDVPSLLHTALPLPATLSWEWLARNASGRAWLSTHCRARLVSPGQKPQYAFVMHRALRRREISLAIGLFRQPRQRVYSNYVHLSQRYNFSQVATCTLAQFLQKRGMQSQSAKMLLGRHYRDERVVTIREAHRAAGIVRRMAFVGLTEQFELSVRLFHARFGGVPHRAQFANVRPGLRRVAGVDKRAETFRYDERVFGGWRDAADEIVYAAASRRFWRDVAELRHEIVKDGLGEVHINFR